MVPEMPRKNGKTTTGSGGEFPPPLDPEKNWQWVEPGMSADLAMRKGGGLAFSAVDWAWAGSKDKSVMVTGVSREDGTIEVTGERDLEGFAEFHLVACPKVVFTGGSPCHGSGRWTVNEEQRADLEKKSPGTVAAFDGQTCLEAFEDFVGSEEKYMPALTAMMTMERRVEVWLEKELREEREYQARRQQAGRSFDMVVADEVVPAPEISVQELALAGQMEKVRTWAESMGILPKACAHAGRRRIYRTGIPGAVVDDCVDCGHDFLKSRAKEPEQFVAPKYDGARCPCGFPDVYRGPCTMHGSAAPKAMPGFTGQVKLYAGTPVGPEHPVLAEAGPSAVGERVEGCARCRRRTPGRSFCSACGDRSTSFELRPPETGW